MGMCRVNGPDALPVVPAGPENLGKATNNICEAGALYAFAHPSDFGQRLPTKKESSEFGDPNEVRYGQGAILDPEMLHYVRHCEKVRTSKRTITARRKRSILKNI